MGDNARPAPLTRHIRTIVPADIHARVSHLALDRNATLGQMVTEALVLLLRYHDVGSGLLPPMPSPAPKAPTPTTTAPAAPATTPSLTGVVPPAAATNVTADVDDYFSIDAVLRDAGVGPLPSNKGHEQKEKGQ